MALCRGGFNFSGIVFTYKGGSSVHDHLVGDP